jgi:hypothetical protein
MNTKIIQKSESTQNQLKSRDKNSRRKIFDTKTLGCTRVGFIFNIKIKPNQRI